MSRASRIRFEAAERRSGWEGVVLVPLGGAPPALEVRNAAAPSRPWLQSAAAPRFCKDALRAITWTAVPGEEAVAAPIQQCNATASNRRGGGGRPASRDLPCCALSSVA